jgi:hypothetical protein
MINLDNQHKEIEEKGCLRYANAGRFMHEGVDTFGGVFSGIVAMGSTGPRADV